MAAFFTEKFIGTWDVAHGIPNTCRMNDQLNFHADLAAEHTDNGNLDRFLFPFAGQEDEHPSHACS